MSPSATNTTAVSATVSLWVPRGEAGDLQDGVAGVLGAIEGVESVAIEAVTDVRPTWTDVRITAEAALEIATDGSPDQDHLRTHLSDGFGVTDVERLTLGGD